MENIVILSSTSFIFRFLPVFLIVYWIAPKRIRNAVIYFGSIIFYAAGSPVFVLLLILLTLLNYLFGVYSWRFGVRRRNNENTAQTGKINGNPVKTEEITEEPDWLNNISEKIELQTKAITEEEFSAEAGRTGTAARNTYIEQRRGKWIFPKKGKTERDNGKETRAAKAGWDNRKETRDANAERYNPEHERGEETRKETGEEIREDTRKETRKETRKDGNTAVEGEAGFVWAVAMDIAVLIVFKVIALKWNANLFPLGLSFYIFKMISYQADLAMGKLEKQPSFMQTAAYFTMFTQITQGPIMRYGDGAFEEPKKFSMDKLEEGLAYVVLGLGMKVLLADRIAILWNEIGKIGYESISTGLAWLGAYSYTFELYFDFWGYSLIAAGVTVMLGFPFIENFRHPYAAVGIGDFYRRWHATLGSWFRDYVYIPLGGSREGNFKTIRNLLTVWVLTGLWHGGTLNFLLWGLILGFIIVLEKYPLKPVLKHIPLFGRLETWILIPLTWVIFAISDLEQLMLYFTRLFPALSQVPVVQDPSELIRLGGLYWPYFAAAAVLCIPGVFRWILKNRRHPVIVLLLTVLFWVSVYYSANMSGNTFMYLNF